jgi:hypothetical protein
MSFLTSEWILTFNLFAHLFRTERAYFSLEALPARSICPRTLFNPCHSVFHHSRLLCRVLKGTVRTVASEYKYEQSTTYYDYIFRVVH